MKFVILCAALALTACVQADTPILSDVPETIITAHVRAFNAGNVEAMGKMQHPNIEWISVTGSTVSVKISGRGALAENMKTYFKSPTKVSSTLRDWNVTGDYVSVTETANWTAKDGTAKSQSSLTVYQLDNNLIRRVWYYPAIED